MAARFRLMRVSAPKDSVEVDSPRIMAWAEVCSTCSAVVPVVRAPMVAQELLSAELAVQVVPGQSEIQALQPQTSTIST